MPEREGGLKQLKGGPKKGGPKEWRKDPERSLAQTRNAAKKKLLLLEREFRHRKERCGPKTLSGERELN